MRGFGFGILTLTVALGLFAAYTYRHLNENLTVVNLTQQLGKDRPDKMDVEGPAEPLNVLVMGSDSRDGEGNNIDGLAGGGQRSDTTILFHLSADRKNAYGVSLPRDAMVQRPTCFDDDGDEIAGGFDMWNAAFSLGGPACTIRQAEQLTGVAIDHFVVLDFNGFKDMVDAIDGVEVCIPEDVDDETGNITLEAGTREVQGQEALDYVRVRYGISNNGDIGRMKRQQSFIASMAGKVLSADTLGRPDRLLGFLNAATKSLTLDEELDSVKKVADLAQQFQGIGLDNIKFITVPFDFYEPDPNRLVWAEDANQLWKNIRFDRPLGSKLSSEVITAARRPGSTASPDPKDTSSPTPEPSDEPSASPVDPAKVAAENGLCA
ncbi:LCP family protein [Nocardioides sp. MJB4]|uniref:LCP family protein n=1 Tax=Nocardioides donggukensis TaxID=2774019 RepID=A0A927KAE3_9ACTN|nr:LCP family protein [Nocardioides donggukensis]